MALGGTVGELQRRMTLAEYYQWVRYRNKNGPFNDVRRFDLPSARIANHICRANGIKSSRIKDHLPFYEEKEPGIDDFIKVFGNAKPR